jgi:uncharacterized protein
MNCPQCNITLVMAERSGVEIDYCPQCRGIWLDRGELDKIIERASQANPKPPVYEESRQAPQNAPYDKHSSKRDDHGHHEDTHGRHGKKKSWIGDIFDF